MDEKMTMDEILKLVEEKQYTRLRQELVEWNEADIASVLEELPHEELIKVFRILPKSIAADVFAFLPVEIEQEIITTLTDREAANIINNLMADDAADLMEEMPAGLVKKLLANADPEARRDINHLLRYPEDSAGSLMTVEFVDLKENLTVTECIDRIRTTGVDKETIDTCYVLDLGRHLIGTVSLRDLLVNQPDAHVVEFMEENVISTNTMTDQEEVARMFQKYDLTTMPVVDNEGRLVGIITIDDVVDIIEEETSEDIAHMAAISDMSDPYLKTPVYKLVLKCVPWIIALMILQVFSTLILSGFEAEISKFAILAVFTPLIMDAGGNSGGQTTTMIVRSLSLDEFDKKDYWKVAWKELRVAALIGGIVAVFAFGWLMFEMSVGIVDTSSIQLSDKIGLIHGELLIATLVASTLFVTMIISRMVGCSLPFLAKLVKLDPAVVCGPFTTTIVDIVSLITYFLIWTQILNPLFFNIYYS